MNGKWAESGIERAIQAADNGQNWAQSLKIGDTFLGAMPEAERQGYHYGTLEYRIFVSVAVSYLPEWITVDASGKIVEMGECR